MSCCNKAPNGGTSDPNLLLKVTLGMLAVIVLLVFLFG